MRRRRFFTTENTKVFTEDTEAISVTSVPSSVTSVVRIAAPPPATLKQSPLASVA
jgi:hypothetical protein